MDDATAKVRFNFTVAQIKMLVHKLQLPSPDITTKEGDRVPSVVALSMLLRRLREPSILFTVANEFGPSVGRYSRVFLHLIDFICSKHKNILYFNRYIVSKRVSKYCTTVSEKGAPLKSCWGFIDGTKQYVSRPTSRNNTCIIGENLQRSIYNGHPRRHCFNWQCITTPDGIIVSCYGPVEGRKHDSTVLSMSRIMNVLSEINELKNTVIYGDPAYGCGEYIICPFPTSSNTTAQQKFNSRMSSVRESVEWSFGRVKVLWGFINYDKKLRVRQTPVGKFFLTAVLLTHLHTCMQDNGNQISMFFNLKPPSVSEYLNK